MTYIVTKVVKGRRYLYEQRTYRQGGRVRTESRYLGPADGGGRRSSSGPPQRKGIVRKIGDLIAANRLTPEERARVVDEDELLREMKAADATRQAAQEKGLAELHDRYGLRLNPVSPMPEEKAAPAIDRSAVAAAPREGPAADAVGPGTEPSE